MSYLPGTVLSRGKGETYSRIKVLTDGKVIVLEGFAVGSVISMDDWHILYSTDIVNNAVKWVNPLSSEPSPGIRSVRVSEVIEEIPHGIIPGKVDSIEPAYPLDPPQKSLIRRFFGCCID